MLRSLLKLTRLPSPKKTGFLKVPTRTISFFKPYNKWNIRTNKSNYSYYLSVRQFSELTVNVPNMGDSISEGTLVEWTKNVGDFCEVDEIVAVIETDKVSIDIRSDSAGELTEQLANIDDTLEVGTPLFKIDTSKQGTSSSTTTTTTTTTATQTTETSSKDSTTQSTTIDKQPTQPTPPPKQSTPSKPTTTDKVTSTTSTTQAFSRETNRVPMSRMRLRIAERLKEAQNTAASLTTFNEIDMTNIINLRNSYKDIFLKKHNVKLGFMSAFLKASTVALQDIPSVNAYIEGKEIIYHNYCDISVAVASPSGLVVPVIRNVESLSFDEIELKIQEYANKAKNGTLSIEEMQGGTFTISNGGVFGSLMGTPILNPPQSAILGMHGTFERAIVINNNIEIRPMMYVALTYDHRIIDGREAVLFLRRIKDCVEDPQRLLLNC